MESAEEGKAVESKMGDSIEASTPTPSSVQFKIAGLPESMNSIYQIIFALKRVELKPDVLRYKVQAKLYMPPWKADPSWLYGIKMQFAGDWWYKKGTVRRVDLSNLEKVICDITSEKYGFDDARIFEKYSWKVQNGAQSFVQVKVYRLTGDDLVDCGVRRGDEEAAHNNG
jgi:hypothetical protein